MRPHKFCSAAVFITFFALLYVWQQTEIFRMAYEGQQSMTTFDDLVDKNAVLRYNINRSASLIHITNKIGQGEDFQMPDSYRLVKLFPKNKSLASQGNGPQRQNFIARIFSVKTEAQAKTINR